MRLQSSPILESIVKTGSTVYNPATTILIYSLFHISNESFIRKKSETNENITAGILKVTAEIPNKYTNGAHRYAYNALCPPPKLIRYTGKLLRYLSVP
jgi:hypothetical protein